jgi:hypothetical protein
MDKTIRMRTRFTLVVGLAAVATAGVGINTYHHHEGTLTPVPRAISVSIAKEYGSLAELRHDADVVALVSVEGVPIPSTRLANIPTVDVQLRIERVLAGTTQVGDTITLVQIGDPTGRITVTEPIPPILHVGKRYVLYLNRQFPNQPQMFLTGLAGVFEADASVGFHRLGDVSPALPKSATLDQF